MKAQIINNKVIHTKIFNEHDVNLAIDKVFKGLIKNYDNGCRVFNEHSTNSPIWKPLGDRLEKLSECLMILQDIIAETDSREKDQKFSGIIKDLEKLTEKDSKEMKLSLEFLKQSTLECVGKA